MKAVRVSMGRGFRRGDDMGEPRRDVDGGGQGKGEGVLTVVGRGGERESFWVKN